MKGTDNQIKSSENGSEEEALRTEIDRRIRRKRQILFERTDPCLALLDGALVSDRRAAVLWSLEGAEELAGELRERIPEDVRPQVCVQASFLWMRGASRMPQVRPSILAVHVLARERKDPVERALCHAVGQGCSALHSPRHAIGLAVYELTARVLASDREARARMIDRMLEKYWSRWERCRERAARQDEWAPFL